MKNAIVFLIVLVLSSNAFADRPLYAVPRSNDLGTVETFLGVATDGTNIVQTGRTNFTRAKDFNTTTNALQKQITDRTGKTNPAVILDSARAGYYGLKVQNVSNEVAGIGFFDFTGAEAFRLRYGTNNGIFDFYDVTNNRTVFRYNGALNTFTFYGATIFPLATPGQLAEFGGNGDLTNSPITITVAGYLATATSDVQAQIDSKMPTNGVAWGQLFSDQDANDTNGLAGAGTFYRWTNQLAIATTNNVASNNNTNLIPVVSGWYEIDIQRSGLLGFNYGELSIYAFTNGVKCAAIGGQTTFDWAGGAFGTKMGLHASGIAYLPAATLVDLRSSLPGGNDYLIASHTQLSIKLLR